MKLPNPFKPTPAPPGFGTDREIPEVSASIFSKVWFSWLDSFLSVGFSRPLEKEDLWRLPEYQLTSAITDKVEANFYARCPPDKRPPSWTAVQSTDSDEEKATEAGYPPHQHHIQHTKPPVEDSSLFKALYHSFPAPVWISGILKLCADTLQTTTPLLNKVLLNWLVQSFVYFKATADERASLGLSQPRGIGYGIGLAFGLFVMQEAASLMDNYSTKVAMELGMSIRTGIIGSVFRKSLRLSSKSRAEHSVGQITTIISTDATKLEFYCMTAHSIWISPIQLAIGIGLLIGNLGYSALVGLGVLIFGFPMQFILVKIMMTQYAKGVKITDQRVRITTEVLQGIRLIKYYAWEMFYSTRIGKLREMELSRVRRVIVAVSWMLTSVSFIPLLGTVLSFITYSLTGHDLNVAVIFTSLQLFNIIRAPLILLPFALNSLADAIVALGRITKFLVADELKEPYKLNYKHDTAVDIDASFVWDLASDDEKKSKDAKDTSEEKEQQKSPNEISPVKDEKNEKSSKEISSDQDENNEKPFELKDVKLSIPKGSFVAIVGRVGSGKSSLLQGILGEMRRVSGEVVLGGSIAYVPQTAWIKNATLRNNIIFGQPEDQDRLSEVIRACSLDQDIQILPYGESTEIGEKGINLSGGQKARISLARAAYSSADIILLDDPLSAVDSHVGDAIMEDCLLSGPLSNRTRILVTHALHVLDKVDYIYVMDNGEIAEHGSYQTLMSNQAAFSRFIEEYGKKSLESGDKAASKTEKSIKPGLSDTKADSPDDTLMQAEDRELGAVSWNVYRKYMALCGGFVTGFILLLLLIINEGVQVATNLFLGFWTAESIPGFKKGDYIAVYGGLGAAQAILSFFLIFVFGYAGLVGSFKLFQAALRSILRSPLVYFDTTPIGRILSRLSKDVEAMDTQVSLGFYQFLSTFSTIFGTVALVFYTFPLLGIIFAPLVFIYSFFAVYYRRSSVETKRLDSLLRSGLYAAYSEALTGLSTIRAYGLPISFVKATDDGLDMENRAYYMTITIQRWLAVRLDLFGNILLLGIGLFAAGFRHTVNPSKIGVVLSYALSITQVFSGMVSQFAQNEQNMNALERLLYYTQLPEEGNTLAKKDPPADWPQNGKISLSNVKLAYRDNLPLALKGVTLQIHPGEKIGVVGRTGAGKSSLVHALLRTVELREGIIEIDDQDIKEIELDILRRRLGLVPQDNILFLGTLRENIDPENLRTDAELISILQKAQLLPSKGSLNPTAEAKFSLDSAVGDEGSNFSVGEKQLLALCRCLVKNSKIIILDEATSSIDAETDAKIQRTIRTEFSSSTLICIAHRLHTIAYYDRIVVMEDGVVAEFDTVLNLFDNESSIFRSLCDKANLQRSDIEKLRAENN